ncbi:hypothetical protein [Sodalis ligni]|uniref:Uncharacterized protein n=1 Tax=Sodalis ligni TaxID=2697027 RepID=A0A4R1NG69_9GAMM|nr:hypothetical protein [Sodalis ligni]TCL03676.1 hypothetical protein EZJ58_1753 [Sodalis ligni]
MVKKRVNGIGNADNHSLQKSEHESDTGNGLLVMSAGIVCRFTNMAEIPYGGTKPALPRRYDRPF